MSDASTHTERERLENQRTGKENWRLWGPYLAERAWGTVREDYSAAGSAWEHFDHDQARARTYRWNEDGLAGLSDERQRLCLALVLWNGRDPILKERPFGLTGKQGNHGEDVKEYYFYLDGTPSHSYLRYLYKYPQAEYPYRRLLEENAQRSRLEPAFSLLDSGVFNENRYWDVEVHYAKAETDIIHARIVIHNRGPEPATLHLLPTLWFRNTWSWGDTDAVKPELRTARPPRAAAWAVQADHPTLGRYWLYGRQPAQTLFTNNESNGQELWGVSNPSAYVKDAFHRYVIRGEREAVNPKQQGTKFSAWHQVTLGPNAQSQIELVLSSHALEQPFKGSEVLFSKRRAEADLFYDALLPEASPQDHHLLRQALAGLIWNKQFFHYDVERWLKGDGFPPPENRRHGRNRYWKHFQAADVISMPDKWEYPWFAAWDLAFHCATLALIDVDFAKDQIELMLKETYLHPNGQIPAYEWAFGDVNPPVHALGALKCFRAERVQRGRADRSFLQRVFHKLLLN
ncbi:MAG: glucosidase, partial [Gammaproteobacteria bacterium]